METAKTNEAHSATIAPSFVKGHLAFSLDGINMEYLRVPISIYGCMGMRWEKLNPEKHFGKNVLATLTFPNPGSASIRTECHIVREFTVRGDAMGLRFHLNAEDKAKLQSHIDQYGYTPTEHLRKHPRIPSTTSIGTFPVRATGVTPNWKEQFAEDKITPLVFDVENISPNGILLSTENPMAKTVRAGETIELVIEPRGDFSSPVRVKGLICRILEDLAPEGNQNIIRLLGIKFLKIDERNRNIFLELLRGILHQYLRKI